MTKTSAVLPLLSLSMSPHCIHRQRREAGFVQKKKEKKRTKETIIIKKKKKNHRHKNKLRDQNA